MGGNDRACMSAGLDLIKAIQPDFGCSRTKLLGALMVSTSSMQRKSQRGILLRMVPALMRKVVSNAGVPLDHVHRGDPSTRPCSCSTRSILGVAAKIEHAIRTLINTVSTHWRQCRSTEAIGTYSCSCSSKADRSDGMPLPRDMTTSNPAPLSPTLLRRAIASLVQTVGSGAAPSDTNDRTVIGVRLFSLFPPFRRLVLRFEQKLRIQLLS